MDYCGVSFGNPSTHVMNITMWTSVLWLELFWSRGGIGSWASWLFPLTGVFFIISTAISRMYLGAHSLNQVLFGASVRIFLACYLHFALKEPVKKHIQKLLEGTEDRPKDKMI